MDRAYKICTRCIMDTSDPDIWFDEKGVCSHCHKYESAIESKSYRKKKEPGALERLLEDIKKKGKGKTYDCIIGVSGGVDSTYTAYLTKQLGLRPLAVHLDNGWDSELAVSNIEKTLKNLGIDLYTYVIDWEEFRDLQLSFLKASTPDSEIPTDHAILAVLYIVAARENVQYILSGHNTATEGGGVAAWSQGHGDWRYIKSIQKQFGTKRLKSFPHYGPLRFVYYNLIKQMKWIQILDYIDYDKKTALGVLQNKLCWKYYGAKHFESIYTRFFQGYILPKKFGYDKKRLHLSSLIWSGQMSREAAQGELANNDYSNKLQEQDKEFVIKKLEILSEEFERIMNQPPKSFWDYPSYKRIFYKHNWIIRIYHSLRRV
ncbi:MAG: N-acetyl sugar amidotransferase [Candidatus Aminicenantes bacterium]|nr:N-acetyl sugar amidotransferase [Candidatus Aminicenantes bacterium]